MQEWEKDFDKRYSDLNTKSNNGYITHLNELVIDIKSFIQAQIDKARAEVAREIFKELDNVWFLDVLYEPDYEQLKAKYIKE